MIPLGRVDTVIESDEDEDEQDVGDEEYSLDDLYALAAALRAATQQSKKTGLHIA